ncbi:MAG TPA: cell division protein FtsA, partial [Sphingomicrobium sp.]|nr:cell division protein FtsA [Sphingomicrobium sp.]
RPRTLAGLPDAHGGPAFSTLVGLASLAASRSGDIRDIALGTLIKQPGPKTMLGRFISAMKRDY